MCGIFGWSLKKGSRPSAAAMIILANRLSNEMDERGGDSWGWSSFSRSRKGIGLIAKPSIIASITQSDQVLAHTRLATTGKVTTGNAHPFRFGHVVGAHNGTVYNHFELNAAYERKFHVDSMHIFAHLKDNLGTEEIQAYGAIEWHDLDDKRTYLCVFNGGSLHATDTKYGVFWASTAYALKKALGEADINHTPLDIQEDIVYFAENGTMYETKQRLDFDYGCGYAQTSVSHSACSYSNDDGYWSNMSSNQTKSERNRDKPTEYVGVHGGVYRWDPKTQRWFIVK